MGSGCSSCSSECLGPPMPTHVPPSHPSLSYDPVTQMVPPLPLAPIHPHHPSPYHPASPCSLDISTALSPSQHTIPFTQMGTGSLPSPWLAVSTDHSQPSLPELLLSMSRTGSSPTLRSSRTPHPSSYWRRRRRPRSCTMLCCTRRRWETGGGVQGPQGQPFIS